MKTVDARGKPCPQPVILTRKALAESDEVLVLVDDETAESNVTRMAEKAGCRVSCERKADGIYIHISGSVEQEHTTSDSRQVVLLLTADTLGRGDAKLGAILTRGLCHTLGEIEPLPTSIILMNSGVRLVVEQSDVLDDLRSLSDRGVQLLACGTCLNHFGLKDKVAVGQVSNMYTIAERLLSADSVITL